MDINKNNILFSFHNHGNINKTAVFFEYNDNVYMYYTPKGIIYELILLDEYNWKETQMHLSINIKNILINSQVESYNSSEVSCDQALLLINNKLTIKKRFTKIDSLLRNIY